MNRLLFLLFLLISLQCVSQNVCIYNYYKVLGSDTINKVSDGKKEGRWLVYEISSKSIACFTTAPCSIRERIRRIIAEGHYVNDRKVGIWKHYYESRDVLSKGHYSNGRKDNYWEYYYITGELRSVDTYDSLEKLDSSSVDEANDTLFFASHLRKQEAYYRNGSLHYRAHFDGGELTRFDIFYESGELKYSGGSLIDWVITDLKKYDQEGNEIPTRVKSFGPLLFQENLTFCL